MSDQCIQYNEEMVGAGHPTKSDTLNRLALVEHNADGTHKHPALGYLAGLGHQRKDADEVTINGGALEINGAVFQLGASTDVQLSGLSNSAWHYLYVTPPSSGAALAAAQFSASTTAPTRDHAKGGAWYNAAGTARCIGFLLTDGSGNILEFYAASGMFRLTGGNSILSTGSPATSATALSADVPDLGRLRVKVWGSVEDSANNSAGLAVGDGDDSGISLAGDSLITVQALGASALYLRSGDREVLTNASGQIYYLCGAGDTSAKLTVFSIGIPNGMAG